MSGSAPNLHTPPDAGRWMTGRWLALGVIVLALGLRLWVVVDAGNAPPVSDGIEYDGYAVSLLSGKGYQNFHEGHLRRSDRLPLYPLLLAGSYGVFGRGALRGAAPPDSATSRPAAP